MRIARKLVEKGEAELFEKAHPQPMTCKYTVNQLKCCFRFCTSNFFTIKLFVMNLNFVF